MREAGVEFSFDRGGFDQTRKSLAGLLREWVFMLDQMIVILNPMGGERDVLRSLLLRLTATFRRV